MIYQSSQDDADKSRKPELSNFMKNRMQAQVNATTPRYITQDTGSHFNENSQEEKILYTVSDFIDFVF